MFIFSFIFEERRCMWRFLRLVCIFETPKVGLVGLGGMTSHGIFFASAAIWHPETYRHEMQHVKDGVAGALLISVGLSVFPLVVLVLKGVWNGVYPLDVAPFFAALCPWTLLWVILVKLVFEFRAFRYAEGLSFRETLQMLMLYAVEKKFGSTVFQFAILTLAFYWFVNWIVYIYRIARINPSLDVYHAFAVLLVPVATTVVMAVVIGWALDVFTRRLFGEPLGKFLFATFVVGAVFHPFLGVVTSFLFCWAMFGKAKDAAVAAAVAAPSSLAVLLPGLIRTSALLL
jgi:MFS family permease